MANLISQANGNLTATNGWATVSTGTGAIQNVVTTKTSYSTTTYTYGTAFTGTNLDVVDGLLIHLKKNGATGTLDIALSDDNGTTATRNLQINISDLPNDYAWVFIKFGSTLTLDGGIDYKVGFKCSTGSSGVTIGNNGSNNWAHYLRLTTLATAAAGDVMYIAGEHTAAGATTTRTITMDSTATTDYGTGTDGAIDNGIEIGDAGILQYGTAASTNYYLKLSGSLNVWANGTLNIGTVATPIPRTSTAILEFDPVADGGMGLIAQALSTVNIQGLSRTASNNSFKCKLNIDAAVNDTTLNVDTNTGWLGSDAIVVASSTRTPGQTEKGTLNGNASAASMAVNGFGGVGGGLANAHSGTSPTQAEIILLTRYVVIRSATSTLMAYFNALTTSIVDVDWAEFYYLGENAANKRGVEVTTTTGTFSMQFSSLHDFEDGGFYNNSTSGNGITFSSNVLWNCNNAGSLADCCTIAASTGVSTLDSNYILGCFSTAFNSIVKLNDVGLTFTNNTVAGCNSTASNSCIPVNLNESNTIGTFSGNVVHSCTAATANANAGFVIGSGTLANLTGTISSCTSYRNTGAGFIVAVSSSNTSGVGKITLTSCTAFGAQTSGNFEVYGAAVVVMNSCTADSDASFSSALGLKLYTYMARVYCFGCSFGVTTAHTTSDINPGSGEVILNNCNLASTTEVTTPTQSHGFVRSHKNDQSGTTFKTTYRFGVIQQDTTTRHTASGYSWKMTPNNATNKLILPGPYDISDQPFQTAVNANTLVTISVYVQKDANYNGNAPRLVLIGGIIGGIANDVTASLTVGSGTWEQLTVTGTPNETGTVEFYVDCDGTAGNIYVDDFSISQA